MCHWPLNAFLAIKREKNAVAALQSGPKNRAISVAAEPARALHLQPDNTIYPMHGKARNARLECSIDENYRR